MVCQCGSLLRRGPLADCTQAEVLNKDLPAECLLADKGYDTDAIAEGAQARGMQIGHPASQQPQATPPI